MANVINGNTFWVEDTSTHLTERVVVSEVILSATGGNASMTLADNSSPSYPNKITISAIHHDTTSAPIASDGIFFPNGVYVVSITNGKATIVFRRAGQ